MHPTPNPAPIGRGFDSESFFLHKCKKNDLVFEPSPMGGGQGAVMLNSKKQVQM